jgi:DNA-nicking Smr family endonuclease
MREPGNYNREETWEELYVKSGEEKTGQNDFRSFAEQFEERGLKGYDKGEKEAGTFRGSDGKRQRYPDEPQAKLDLHGYTLDEARPMLQRFIDESRQMGLIFVIVIPGIGRNSEDGRAKLRPMVVQALEKLVNEKMVRDFKSAEPRHGGFGALYIYLK